MNSAPPIWSIGVRANLERLNKWSKLSVLFMDINETDLASYVQRKCRNIKNRELQELVSIYGNDLGSILEWIELGSNAIQNETSLEVPILKLNANDTKLWEDLISGKRVNCKKLKDKINSLLNEYTSKLNSIVEDDPFTDTEDETTTEEESSDSEHSEEEDEKK